MLNSLIGKHTEALAQSPDQKQTIKKAAEQDKALRAFESSVTKDIKLGLKVLQEAVKKGEPAEVPYYLHLDYFTKAPRKELEVY